MTTEVGSKDVTDHKYRIFYRYRQWKGKPDPSNMGTAYIYSDDPGWITQQCSKLKANGHQVLKVQKRHGKQWRTM